MDFTSLFVFICWFAGGFVSGVTGIGGAMVAVPAAALILPMHVVIPLSCILNAAMDGSLAFILNVPMRAIERHLLQNSRRGAKLRRPLALVLTLLAVLGVLALASLVIGPGIADAVMSIIREIPAAFDRLQKQLNGLAEGVKAGGKLSP